MTDAADGAPPWGSGVVTTRARCVLAPNPGPMTLDGTNTWVLLEPGSTEAVVIDPGPLDEPHLRAVLDTVEELGAHVALTLLTHGHADHAESAGRFAELTRAPVRALGTGTSGQPGQHDRHDHDDLRDGHDLHDGQVLTVGGLEVAVVRTPGHTSDSLSFLLAADNALLTGDTILGRGTTMVAWPDGELAAYLDSLERIESLTGSGAVLRILPGHGPQLPEAAAVVRHYRQHRAERLEQVKAAVAGGASDPRAVVETVYADVSRELWPAAELSVRAQLDYLTHRRPTDRGHTD